MWNLREWGTFIKKTIKGAVWGVGVGVATLFYGLFAEMWNCFCDKLADRFYLPEVADTNITVFAFVICVAIGMISGIVSATKDCKDRIKKENTDRERRNHAAVCVRLKEMTALSSVYMGRTRKRT